MKCQKEKKKTPTNKIKVIQTPNNPPANKRDTRNYKKSSSLSIVHRRIKFYGFPEKIQQQIRKKSNNQDSIISQSASQFDRILSVRSIFPACIYLTSVEFFTTSPTHRCTQRISFFHRTFKCLKIIFKIPSPILSSLD